MQTRLDAPDINFVFSLHRLSPEAFATYQIVMPTPHLPLPPTSRFLTSRGLTSAALPRIGAASTRAIAYR